MESVDKQVEDIEGYIFLTLEGTEKGALVKVYRGNGTEEQFREHINSDRNRAILVKKWGLSTNDMNHLNDVKVNSLDGKLYSEVSRFTKDLGDYFKGGSE